MNSPLNPFERIGLCFSGGGYRATFYSLGVLSYLNRSQFKGEPLLSNVQALSTVSGGTLTGVSYAIASQKKPYDFDAYYTDMYERFKPGNDKLLETAVKILEDNSKWKTTSKKRSVINAFALAYREMSLFEGTFDLLQASKLTKSNLKYVCFNATDFSFGLTFRFQNTGNFGNYRLYCKEMNPLIEQVELSDAVASSSCFPLGFAPVIFPDDYFENHTDSNYTKLKELPNFEKGVGIMDGGIVDNQGIGSMVNINKSKGPLDLIIINDVGSYKMEPWIPESAKTVRNKSLKDAVLGLLKYFGMNWLFILILLLGVGLLIIDPALLSRFLSHVAVKVLGGILTGAGLILTLLGVAGGILKSAGLKWFKSIFKKNVPEALVDDIASFQNLNINLIKRMLEERITSGVKMVNDVFLKQIRRLNYDLIYNTDNLKNRIITSTIYELNGQETLFEKRNLNSEIPDPSTALKAVALTASETPTTLWWDDKDVKVNRMDALLACGQFNTCYNLMDYIIKLRKDGLISDGDKPHVDALYAELENDWMLFNKDPMMMVKS